MVAMGTLRRGFLTTAADTDALSTPINAHRVKFSVPEIACTGLEPETFKLDVNSSGLNQNQPNSAVPIMGTSANMVVTD